MNKGGVFCIVLVVAVAFSSMTLMPEPVLAQTEKGIELYNHWQCAEAEKVLREALKKDPQDIRGQFYLGLSLLMQDKNSEALDLFLKTKDLRGKAGQASPAEPDAYHLEIALARAHLGLEQYPEAWKRLENAKELNDHDAEVYVYRGVYYHLQKKEKQAIKELEKAMRLDEHHAYAHYYAGQVYLRLGNAARAVDMFKIFLNAAPDAPEAPKTKLLIDALC